MRIAAFVLCALLTRAAGANERFLAEETVEVKQVRAVPPTPDDPGWAALPAKAIGVAPQGSVRLNDATANARREQRKSARVTIKAAYDHRALGVWLEWEDESEDLAGDETNAFADTVALQLPARFGPGTRLPYIGMGDEEQHVYVYRVRASSNAPGPTAHVAAGFGSLTRQADGGLRGAMRYDRARKRWRALIVRPLVVGEHSLAQGLVPFALAVWDGARAERGGDKLLSSWKFLRLASTPIPPGYLEQLAWGYGPSEVGDAAKGKALVDAMCSACHHVGERRFAPPGFAPDLSTIGAIATYPYLRDSVVAASDVIVPHLNVNRHYSKSGRRDANGAYPNNETYVWYVVGQDGKKQSKMPDFKGLPAQNVADIVAYLKTLGATAP